MLHPSYTELMKIVNRDQVEDDPVLNSRYALVLATAKRARQINNGQKAMSEPKVNKPLSIAVDELQKGLLTYCSKKEELPQEETTE